MAVAVLSTVLFRSARGDVPDQDQALSAVERGASVPLDAVLARVRAEHPGKVLNVELETEGNRLIYEVTLLAPGGRVERWRYDAQSLAAVPPQPDRPASVPGKDE